MSSVAQSFTLTRHALPLKVVHHIDVLGMLVLYRVVQETEHSLIFALDLDALHLYRALRVAKTLLSHSASWAPHAPAMYSASSVDAATVGISLDLQHHTAA
jgi:hypothetical protein